MVQDIQPYCSVLVFHSWCAFTSDVTHIRIDRKVAYIYGIFQTMKYAGSGSKLKLMMVKKKSFW
jgi:hypothetical protein